MHPTLSRQLKKTVGEAQSLPLAVQELLKLVDETYHHSDEDRVLMERSLDISSRELGEKRQQLEALTINREVKMSELKEQIKQLEEQLQKKE